MYGKEIDDMADNERKSVFITRHGAEFEVIHESPLGVVVRPKHDVPLEKEDYNYGGNYVFVDVVGGKFRVDYNEIAFASFTEAVNQACQILKYNQRCAESIEQFMKEQERVNG